jgi:hypothetical protein
MSRTDDHEKASADIEVALFNAKSALKTLNAAQPLGKSARVLNPRARLLTALGEAITALDGCTDEYSKMLEAAVIEAEHFK